MTRDPLLPVRLVDGVWTTEGATVEIGGQTVRAAVTWGEPGVRVRNFPCFPDPSVFADVVLPPRPADDYARAFAEYNPPPRSEVEITVTMDADEAPELYRLRGDDEEGWMIDDDPLLRVWDTAADAMAEVPGDWWEEEAGCWMAAAIESSTTPRRADNARKIAEHNPATDETSVSFDADATCPDEAPIPVRAVVTWTPPRRIFAALHPRGYLYALGDTEADARENALSRRNINRDEARSVGADFPPPETDAVWADELIFVTVSGTTESLRIYVASVDDVIPWCPADLWDSGDVAP